MVEVWLVPPLLATPEVAVEPPEPTPEEDIPATPEGGAVLPVRELFVIFVLAPLLPERAVVPVPPLPDVICANAGVIHRTNAHRPAVMRAFIGSLSKTLPARETSETTTGSLNPALIPPRHESRPAGSTHAPAAVD